MHDRSPEKQQECATNQPESNVRHLTVDWPVRRFRRHVKDTALIDRLIREQRIEPSRAGARTCLHPPTPAAHVVDPVPCGAPSVRCRRAAPPITARVLDPAGRRPPRPGPSITMNPVLLPPVTDGSRSTPGAARCSLPPLLFPFVPDTVSRVGHSRAEERSRARRGLAVSNATAAVSSCVLRRSLRARGSSLRRCAAVFPLRCSVAEPARLPFTRSVKGYAQRQVAHSQTSPRTAVLLGLSVTNLGSGIRVTS